VVDWFLTNIGDPVVNALTQVLVFFHDLVEPAVGVHSWGWAIVMLTLVVRIAMLPLAIKQTRSMRAMQKLQPQMKELQKKYKVDRSLLKKDPEQYKAKKQKLNEEMMALYQREGANPAASCLPILAQAPIFIALFWTLVRSDDLVGQPFYFITRYVPELGLTGPVSGAGWPGWLMIALMSGTMFLAQKQMMARNPAAAEGPMAQQQKIMLYAMPALLAFISFRFPLGVLLYWVTTNFWQVAQQAIILREVKHELEQERAEGTGGGGKSATTGGGDKGPSKGAKGATSGGGDKGPSKGAKGATSGKKSGKAAEGPKAGGSKNEGQAGSNKKKQSGSEPKKGKAPSNGQPAGGGRENGPGGASGRGSGSTRKRDHIPRRGGGGRQR
jgi:YidC/Oxa1 family membrane protein insertase